MEAVGLALLSAALFGAMAATLGLAFRRHGDAEAGALATGIVALAVNGGIALATHQRGGELWPFLLAGILAPGASQILYVRAVKEVGASRASIVVGAAPLVAVTIAILALGEPLRAPLILGATLIVAGCLTLTREGDRPETFRAVGLLLAFGSVLCFATRDNIVRHLASDTSVEPQLAAAVTILTGSAFMAAYLLVARGSRMTADVGRAFRWFAVPGALWGLSYTALFEALYRGRVSVVNPLVATEALFGVLFAAIVLGRSELVGRHVIAGAALVVAGGIVIGVFRT
jgi:drug/metabolite transporter (DMT)-like permease